MTVIVPAHNEARTLPGVLARTAGTSSDGDARGQVLVVDDGSDDGTAAVAHAAGARVVTAHGSRPGKPVGKGRAMETGLHYSAGEIVVLLDADVTELHPDAVAMLAAPLLRDPTLALVKARYARDLAGVRDEGGRVNALLARPLLRRLCPDLAHLQQPLSGEYAVRRKALDGIALEPGYGVEIGLLLDVSARHGTGSIAEVDLGTRSHRNRPLHQLTGHADAILDAVLRRTLPSPTSDVPTCGAR